jgi:hypothetical protein
LAKYIHVKTKTKTKKKVVVVVVVQARQFPSIRTAQLYKGTVNVKRKEH